MTTENDNNSLRIMQARKAAMDNFYESVFMLGMDESTLQHKIDQRIRELEEMACTYLRIDRRISKIHAEVNSSCDAKIKELEDIKINLTRLISQAEHGLQFSISRKALYYKYETVKEMLDHIVAYPDGTCSPYYSKIVEEKFVCANGIDDEIKNMNKPLQ